MKQKKTVYKNRKLRWNRLDNTANLFPVIATKSTTNVYRISVTLTDEIKQEILQAAVERVLEYFDIFQFRLKKVFFGIILKQTKDLFPK